MEKIIEDRFAIFHTKKGDEIEVWTKYGYKFFIYIVKIPGRKEKRCDSLEQVERLVSKMTDRQMVKF